MNLTPGEFPVVCLWLLRGLVDIGLSDDNMKNMIIAHTGSVQNIPNIPDDVKAIYKTVDISQKNSLLIVVPLFVKIRDVHVHPRPLAVDEHAFLWMEEGIEDWHVLSSYEAYCASRSIYCDQSLLKQAKRQMRWLVRRVLLLPLQLQLQQPLPRLSSQLHKGVVCLPQRLRSHLLLQILRPFLLQLKFDLSRKNLRHPFH